MEWLIAVSCYAAAGIVACGVAELTVGWLSDSLARLVQFGAIGALLFQACRTHGIGFAAAVWAAALVESLLVLVVMAMLATIVRLPGSDDRLVLRKNR